MKKVLILFGGNSYEHEISCKSVNFVIKNIDTDLFCYSLVGIDFNNDWYKVSSNKDVNIKWKDDVVEKIDNIIEYCKGFDIVFPLIHGNTCEDGKLQSMFELFNIKYVGSNSYSSLISYDKYLCKVILEKYDIPQIEYGLENNLDYPVIIKPSKCGSSIGINVARNENEFNKYIDIAKRYDDIVVIEKYIESRRELECAILEVGNELMVSDVGEIVVDDWYDYDSKYERDTKTIISDIDDNIKNKVKEYSKYIFKLLGCKDFARVDFLYDVERDKLYFNEINTIPGFTEISMYPKLIKYSGINYMDLISILINNCFD